MNRLTPQELVAAVQEHAYANYDDSKGYGWSCVIETQSDDDILEMIEGARTAAGAIRKVASYVRLWNEQASNCW